MTTQTMCLPIQYLRALLPFASKKDVRYYLCGIAISQEHAVATTGEILLAIKVGGAYGYPETIIPNDAISFFLKKTKGSRDGTLVEIERGENQGVLRLANIEERFTPIDGRYPDWTRAVPHRDSPNTGLAQFPWSQLAKFEEAAVVLGASSKQPRAILEPCGPGNAARVLLPVCRDAIGVATPWRTDAVAKVCA